MKLKVIGDRGELRDHFDLMEIDQRGIVPVGEGLQLFVERYDPPNPEESLTTIVKSLGGHRSRLTGGTSRVHLCFRGIVFPRKRTERVLAVGVWTGALHSV